MNSLPKSTVLRYTFQKVLIEKNMIRKRSVNQPDITNMLLKPAI